LKPTLYLELLMHLAPTPDAMNAMIRSIGAAKRTVYPDDILDAAFQLLSLSGYERARYYQLGSESVPGVDSEQTLYLSWQRSASKERLQQQELGYSIPWRESSLSRQDSPVESLDPIAESDYGRDAGTIKDEWVEALGLNGRSWVDAPVYNHRRLIGVLAVDWKGPKTDFTDEASVILALFGTLLGTELTATSPPIQHRLQGSLSVFSADASSADDLVLSAVQSLQQELRIASASVFKFDWTRQELRRFPLTTFPPRSGGKTMPSEVYPVGQYLTGMAWVDSDYRSVLDFKKIHDARSELVQKISFDYHRQVVGPITSIMYGIAGDRDHRYLIRLINGGDRPRPPILSERATVEGFFLDLAPVIDNRIASERSSIMSRLLRLLASHAEPDVISHEVAQSLRLIDGIHAIVIMARRTGDNVPYFFWGLPDRTIRTVRDGLFSDHVYNMAVAPVGHGVHYQQRVPGSALIEMLQSIAPDLTGVGSIGFAAGMTQGALLIPLIGPRRKQDISKSLSAEATSFLTQLASTIGQALESSFVSAQSRGALTALSLVGHEMVTPLAAMSSVTESAISVAKHELSVSRGNGNRVSPTIFDDLQSRLQYHKGAVDAAVRLGNVVGRQTERRIVGMRRPSRIRELINKSIFRVGNEIARGLLLAPENLIFTLPTGNTLVEPACDEFLIEAALANIYRNAAKYSKAWRSTAARVETDVRPVSLEERESLDITITNEGIGIPRYQEEFIFQPFVRLVEDEPDLTRRGMGLGLFLARQIARSHGGDVTLREHVPVQDQRARRKGSGTGNIYRVSFAFRMRLDLPPGEYRFDIP
jgi:signal transduction histidine kinase